VRVWSLDRAEPLAVLRGHEGWVRSLVMLGPERLASAGEDGTVRVWEVDPIRLLADAARRSGRNLSSDEWRLYFGERPYRRTFPEWPPGETRSRLSRPTRHAESS
jgi:WD40 repeat protein